MPRDIYTVVLHEKQWKVRFAGKHSPSHATQNEAIAAAVDAARKTGEVNPEGAQVRVQNPGSGFRTEWTYGQDQ